MPDRFTSPRLTSLLDALARAEAHSPFLRAALARHPDLAALLASGNLTAALDEAPQVAAGEVRTTLRRQRDRLALVVAIGDLANAIPVEDVTRTLSDFADDAFDAAVSDAFAARYPQAPVAGFVALALGKHGGRELNYSSDIDPILLFDPATMPHRAREEAGEAAVRIARAAVDLLQTRDRDGYVFRVDLRLRPASEATPIALPVDAAIGHYESSALPWERAAFIRARSCAGDRALGDRFLAAIAPFVWRRSLDFGAVEELRALTRRIRDQAGSRPFGPGYDLKRGRGGIREIEFFVQIHQLIHGGRDPALRPRDTLSAIAALADAGWIEEPTATVLHDAYRLFRTIEHRLQMVDDRQTHMIPPDGEALDNVAALHGLGSGAALLDSLAPHVEQVGRLYDALDDRSGGGVAAVLPPALAARVAAWRGGQVRALRSPAALAAFDAALPHLAEGVANAPDPDAMAASLDRLLGGLPSAVNLFRLLDARPALTATLIDILGHAPVLADALAQRPALFDRLLDATAFADAGDVAALGAEMAEAGDLEATLDRVRHVVGEHRFALGTQVIAGRADPLVVAHGYARVAQAATMTVVAATQRAFAQAHGAIAGGELTVLALGRLGGRALTHASDLDLVYLFTGERAAQSDGARPLGTTLYFNRLAQRVTSGLSVPTSVGPLYDVDTRLRPSGNQGPLAVSLDTFARYQTEAAWTWEHMALCRARVVAGPSDAVDAIVARTLRSRRDRSKLVRDVVAMRRDIAMHKPPGGPLDVKLAPGGLVDLEFVVHFHQLAQGIALSPDLAIALAALAAAGLVPAALGDAYALLTRLLMTVRLVAPTLAEPGAATRAIVARACGASGWEALMRDVDAAKARVREAWGAMVSEAS